MSAVAPNTAGTASPGGKRRGLRPGMLWDLGGLALFGLLPVVAALAHRGSETALPWADVGQVSTLFIYGILALGLNVVVGYTGLLHLGIGAFFGIGAYITGILTVAVFPFQLDFPTTLVLSTLGAALCGLILGAPTLRLRGDYLALVTLGFGEVATTVLRNLKEITNGTQSLSPLPKAGLPHTVTRMLGEGAAKVAEVDEKARQASETVRDYYLTFAILVGVVLVLRNLERSRLGRAWVALREDELAATCMGIDTARIKLAAFAISAGIAGLAGCLYATLLSTTAKPDTYGFNLSVTILCCVILGGLGSIRGALLGVLLLYGYELFLAPWLDQTTQGVKSQVVGWLSGQTAEGSSLPERVGWLLTFTNWKLLVYGLALIITVRFRPGGLLPSRRVQHEIEDQATKPA